MFKHVGSSPWSVSEQRLVFEEPSQRPPAQPQEAYEQGDKTFAHTVQELGKTLTDFLAEKKDAEKRNLAERVRELLEQVKSKIEGAPEDAKRLLKEKWAEVQQYSTDLLGMLPKDQQERMRNSLEFVGQHLESITQNVRAQMRSTLNFSEAIGKKVGTLFAGVKLPEFMQAFWKDTQEFGAWIGRTVQGFIDNFLIGLDEKDATGKYKNSWLRTLFAAQIPAAKKRIEEAAKGAPSDSGAGAQNKSPEVPPPISLEQFGLDARWKVDTAHRVPPGFFSFGPLEGGKRSYKIDATKVPISLETAGAKYEISAQPDGAQILLTPKIHSASFSPESILTFKSPTSEVEQSFTLREIMGTTASAGKSASDVKVTIRRIV